MHTYIARHYWNMKQRPSLSSEPKPLCVESAARAGQRHWKRKPTCDTSVRYDTYLVRSVLLVPYLAPCIDQLLVRRRQRQVCGGGRGGRRAATRVPSLTHPPTRLALSAWLANCAVPYPNCRASVGGPVLQGRRQPRALALQLEACSPGSRVWPSQILGICASTS